MSAPWLTRPPSPLAAYRLFCLPYAGGTAAIFHRWSQYLGAAIDVCPIHLPGRGRRMHEPAATDALALVEAILPVLAPYCDAPFALFGHSMGALLAYELVRALRHRCDRHPVRLFVSAHAAPHLPSRLPPQSYDLPDDELIRTLRAYEGSPLAAFTDADLKDMFLPTLRADFRLVQTYRPRPAAILTCPVTVLGGLDDGEVPREDLPGWQDCTSGACRVALLPGGHFFINESPAAVCQIVADDLQRVDRSREAAGRSATAGGPSPCISHVPTPVSPRS